MHRFRVEVIDNAGVVKKPGTSGVLPASATCVTLPTTATGSLYASPGRAFAGTWATTTIAGVSVVPAGMPAVETTTLTEFAGAFERTRSSTAIAAAAASTTPRSKKIRLFGLFAWMATCSPRLSHWVSVTLLRLHCIQPAMLARMTAAPECGSNPPCRSSPFGNKRIAQRTSLATPGDRKLPKNRYSSKRPLAWARINIARMSSR